MTGYPRVLHVAQPTSAGVAGYVAAAAVDQALRGWHVTVASPPHGDLPERLVSCGIEHLPWHAGRSPGAASVPEAVRLRRLVARLAPDVLHLHSAKAGLAGRLAVRGDLPTLFQPHGWSWLAVDGPLARATRHWERWAARWCSAVVCVGQAEAEAGRNAGVRAPIAVIRNGVDLDRFAPADEGRRRDCRAALGLDPTVPVVLCVGRLTRQKGQDVLLAAWPEVLRRYPETRLILVGDGDLAEPLQAAAPPGVRFVALARDVRSWYAAADVVALPSRWEGLPLTLLEAMAVGRPVVASDIPGITGELPTEAGTLVPPEDPAALAGALADLLCREDEARARGAAAARYARQRPDARATFDALAALTREVLAGGDAAHPAGHRYRP